MFTCSTLLLFPYPVPADIHGSVQHVTLEYVPVDVLPRFLKWFSQVKHFKCRYIQPPQEVPVCTHVQCGLECTRGGGAVYVEGGCGPALREK